MSRQSFAVSGYGLVALVEGPAEGTATTLRRRLPATIRVRTAPTRLEAGRCWIAADSADLTARVLPELELWIAEWAPDHVFVHAGCVAWQGRALLLPGRSHAGKTTLTAALLRRGAGYLSDEFAVLDRTGRVHPYARPLGRRTPEGRHEVLPEELGAPVVDGPLPVALIAQLRYTTTTAGTDPASAARGALALLENTVCARSRPDDAITATTRAAEGAAVLIGTRSEADPFADQLLARLRDRPG